MFSKSRINDPGPRKADEDAPRPVEASAARPAPAPESASRPKPPASVLSADLTVTGNLRTTGDIVVEGTVDGDIRAHLLTVGEGATIRGEVVADDVVINGRIVGRVRGLKVRLSSSARVEGDIIHKTIAIESGAHFEGSVQRQDDPINTGKPQPQAAKAEARPQSAAPQPQSGRPSGPAQAPAKAAGQA